MVSNQKKISEIPKQHVDLNKHYLMAKRRKVLGGKPIAGTAVDFTYHGIEFETCYVVVNEARSGKVLDSTISF